MQLRRNNSNPKGKCNEKNKFLLLTLLQCLNSCISDFNVDSAGTSDEDEADEHDGDDEEGARCGHNGGGCTARSSGSSRAPPPPPPRVSGHSCFLRHVRFCCLPCSHMCACVCVCACLCTLVHVRACSCVRVFVYVRVCVQVAFLRPKKDSTKGALEYKMQKQRQEEAAAAELTQRPVPKEVPGQFAALLPLSDSVSVSLSVWWARYLF